MPAFVDVSGTWRHLIPYVNISGAWRQIPQIYINVNNTWRPLWTYSWSIGGWGTCSATCGGGTQTRTITCIRSGDNKISPDTFCTSQGAGTKPPTSQPCNTQSCLPKCRCTCCQYMRYYTNTLPCTAAVVGSQTPNLAIMSHTACLINGTWSSCSGGEPCILNAIYGIQGGENTPGVGSDVLRDNLGRTWNCFAQYWWCGNWDPCSRYCSGVAN